MALLDPIDARMPMTAKPESTCSRLSLSIALLAAVLACVPEAQADWVWRPQIGWVDPNKAPRDTAQLRYTHAVVLMTQGHGKSAAKEFKRLLKEFPKAKWAEDALFNVGEAYHLGGYQKRSAKAFEEYVNAHPAGRHTEQALKRMLAVGIILSEKRGSMESAVDVLEKVIELGPTGDLADDAMAAIGDAYFRAGHYDEAADAYQDIPMRFPTSEWVQAIPLKTGRCYMRKGSHLRVNPEAYAQARFHFEEYVRNYPNGVQVAAAKEYIAKAKSLQAQAEYSLAAFYVRIKKPKSAAIYLKTVIQSFPGTDPALRSRALLDHLKEMDVIQ